ncbi:hypothetical protein Bca4012_010192 [Brassica carinata]
MENEDTSQASASIEEEESVNTKLNRIIEVMEENVKSMKDRMSLLEEENMQLKARVSELEGNQNVGPHTQTVVFPTNVTQQNETQPSNETPLSPMYQQNETQDFSPNVRQQKETLDGTPFNPNRAEENIEDEIEKEPSNQTLPAQTQFFSTNETQMEPLNDESPTSPASQQIETQVFPPNPTQHIEQEPISNETPDAQTTTDPLTDPLTELISSIASQYMNSDENTQAVANTPASPTSSLKLDENQNDAVVETQMNESHASPKSQQIDTQIQHVKKEPSYDTSALDTQVFTPNLTQEFVRETLPSESLAASQKSIETQVFTPIQTQQMETEGTYEITEPLTEIISANNKKAEENRLPTLFEIGADVEIASNEDTTCRIWYPAKVVDLNGVDRVTVDFYRTVFAEKKKVQNTITTEKIRPAPPTSFQKAFEMNDNVEGFYKNGWYSGQVKMVLGDNTYSVYLNSSMETIQFEPSHLRIHREWIDGVWKMADEMQTGYFKGPETQSQDLSQQDHVIKEKLNKKRKAAGSSQELGKDTVVPFLRRSERVPKRSRDTKTPFKFREEPCFNFDPFSTPTDHKFQRLQNWLTSTGGVHGHIDGALAMLNCRRNENAAWFHNNKILKAYFLPTTFFLTLGYYIDLIETCPAEGKKIFADGQTELVRGEIDQKKKWGGGEDVDVLYGVIVGRYGKHLIGMAVDLKKGTITLFHCGLPTEDKNNDISQIEDLAVLIPALMMEAFGEEVNKKEVVPYKIEKAEGIPKTHSRFNCALFVLKMLECHSLKIEDMSKINDDNAMELRRSLSCEIFNQFVDANV